MSVQQNSMFDLFEPEAPSAPPAQVVYQPDPEGPTVVGEDWQSEDDDVTIARDDLGLDEEYDRVIAREPEYDVDYTDDGTDISAAVDEAALEQHSSLSEVYGWDTNLFGEEVHDAPVSAGPVIYELDDIIGEAIRWFRRTGFPYRKLPLHICMQEINRLATTDPDALLHSDAGYQVADTYHPHRFHATANGMRSPYESFMDDRRLRIALGLVHKYTGVVPDRFFSELKFVQGTQMCHNFRPGFALKLYREYCQPGSVVLDTSTGYGGRLVGWIASGLGGEYVGIDPNEPTYKGNLQMASDLGVLDRVHLYMLPAEDVKLTWPWAGKCDFAFTSPPYFSKEIYSEDSTQAHVRYPEGDEWLAGFLYPLLRLQYASLKPGAWNLVNINDVKIKGTKYPLVEWTVQAAEDAGFVFDSIGRFQLTKKYGKGHEDEISYEPVLKFRKPE